MFVFDPPDRFIAGTVGQPGSQLGAEIGKQIQLIGCVCQRFRSSSANRRAIVNSQVRNAAVGR